MPGALQETPTAGTSTEDNVLVVTGALDLARTYTELRLSDGQVVRLRTEALLTGTARNAQQPDEQRLDSPMERSEESMVVPIVEEQLTVAKRTVATGVVRLHKSVQEYQQALDETLAVRTFDVERVTLNRVVERAPEIREEGDTTIYPILEERLVLTKELVLKEELRVTKRDSSTQDTQVVTLLKEQITVERIPSERKLS